MKTGISYGVPDADSIEFYTFNKTKAYLLYPIIAIFTLGIVPLASYWFLGLRLFLAYTKSENGIEDATHIVIFDQSNDGLIIELVKTTRRHSLRQRHGQLVETENETYTEIKFIYRHISYIYNAELNNFAPF